MRGALRPFPLGRSSLRALTRAFWGPFLSLLHDKTLNARLNKVKTFVGLVTLSVNT